MTKLVTEQHLSCSSSESCLNRRTATSLRACTRLSSRRDLNWRRKRLWRYVQPSLPCAQGGRHFYVQFLETFKRPQQLDRATLVNVAHTSLATKVNSSLAKTLAAEVVDAVLTIRPPPPSPGNALLLDVPFRRLTCHRLTKPVPGADRPAHGGDHEDAAQNCF